LSEGRLKLDDFKISNTLLQFKKIRLNNVEVQTKARRDGEIMLALT
jgi:hypothetical protein